MPTDPELLSLGSFLESAKPVQGKTVEFGVGEYITDMATSPKGMQAAIVSQLHGGRTRLELWNFILGELGKYLANDARFFRKIEWSPSSDSIFVLAD